MLKSIQEKPTLGLFLIQDDEDTSGLPLLISLMKQYLSNNLTVNLCLYEHHPVEFRSLPFFDETKFVLHDFYSISDEWNQEHVNFKSVFSSLTQSFNVSFNCDTIVIIDSLNPLLRTVSSQKCLWMLHQLLSNKIVSSVISLFHSHLLSQSICMALKHSATTYITVTNEFKKQFLSVLNNVGNKEKSICSIVHKKQNGKVVITNEEYFICSKSFDIVSKAWTPIKNCVKINQTSSPLMFDDSGITFNLNLSKVEDIQRKNLVMPYSKTQIILARNCKT